MSQPTINEVIAHLQQLVKEDPSVGDLPLHSNSPMDDQYSFGLGHIRCVHVGEVYQDEDGNTYIHKDYRDDDCDVTAIRVVIIDTH